MQYALVSSTCKTTHRNMSLAVERDVKQQLNLNKSEGIIDKSALCQVGHQSMVGDNLLKGAFLGGQFAKGRFSKGLSCPVPI